MASAAGVSAEDVINAKEVEIEKLEAAIVTNEAKIKEILNCQEFNIHLTISDEKSISGAVVIIEKVL